MAKTKIFRTIKDTERFAHELAKKFLQKKGTNRRAVVLGLVGSLGSGKTTFTQSLIAGLGIKERVLSPTFVILKRFHLPRGTSFLNAYHIDAYRIGPKDLVELGWEKILSEYNIVIIEWADRIKTALPADTLWINFTYGKTENERKVTFN